MFERDNNSSFSHASTSHHSDDSIIHTFTN